MKTNLDVLFTPADFAVLPRRDLRQTVCVVFDVLRATSSMLTALAHGARAIRPVAGIPEALAVRARQPDVLLAGERNGLRIRAAQADGIDFDLGNSPREFTPERVRDRTIVMTTTNGTRALQSCRGAAQVLAGGFLNLGRTADHLRRQHPQEVLVVCSGTFEQPAFEDVLAAGALCERLWADYGDGDISDGAQIARQVYGTNRGDLMAAVSMARNGRRLLAHPDLRDDVPACLQMDRWSFLAGLEADGMVRRWD